MERECFNSYVSPLYSSNNIPAIRQAIFNIPAVQEGPVYNIEVRADGGPVLATAKKGRYSFQPSYSITFPVEYLPPNIPVQRPPIVVPELLQILAENVKSPHVPDQTADNVQINNPILHGQRYLVLYSSGPGAPQRGFHLRAIRDANPGDTSLWFSSQ